MQGTITLKFGGASGLEKPMTLSTDNMTIFVGPNNSGKSLLLKEVEKYFGDSVNNVSYKIVSDIEQHITDVDGFLDLLRRYVTSESNGMTNVRVFNPSSGNLGYRFEINNLREQITSRNNMRTILDLLKFFTIRLDGSTRMAFTNNAQAGDLQNPPENLLTALFKDNIARSEISQFTLAAFGYHFVIDPTGMQQFRIRLSRVAPKDLNEEQSLTLESTEFHRQATLIDTFSDGVKATLGLLMPVLCGDYKVILIDEPEAFLHPPLARRLGRKLAEVSKRRQSTLLISTHSSDFLMGCIESGMNINLVRLTYSNSTSGAKLLKPEELLPLMRDPLLRSSDTMSALFHRSAIVTESDIDRIFYQEINNRLQESNKTYAEDCSFLNAQNWQTIGRIITPLRKLGIPCAAIVDIDVLMSGGDEWKRLLTSCGIPEEMIDILGNWKGQIHKALFDAVPDEVKGEHQRKIEAGDKGPDKRREYVKKNGGISILSGGPLDTAERLIRELQSYGLFVVPIGEVEAWLSHFEVRKHGPAWVIPMFERMGNDPDSSSYVRPPVESDDVWSFMEKVANYLNMM